MRLEVIDHHSVAVDLLAGGLVVDAGCRGFVFAEWFAARGHEVVALDPAPDIEHPLNPRIAFLRVALIGKRLRDEVVLDMTGDPGAWHVRQGTAGHRPATYLLSQLMGTRIDVLKLNIEGAEYDVLEDLDGPLAKQIVISFHEHTPRGRGRAECDRLIDRLREWYCVVQHDWEPRYCAHPNYWDTLLVRKDLA